MIEPNYYESFLNNLPPEESVRGVIGFAESLEQHFIDYFSPPINQAKEILISNQEDQKKVEREIDIEINSWKDEEKKVEHSLYFILGKDYISPLLDYKDSKDMDESDCFLSIELLCKSEEIAISLLNEINTCIIPRVDEFEYYRAFKQLNGSFKFLQNKNKICLCLSRKTSLFRKFAELINSLQLEKYNFGINSRIKIQSTFHLSQTPSLSLEEFFKRFLVFKLNINAKILNYHEIVTTLINVLKDDLKDLSNLLSTYLILEKLKFGLDINPSGDLIINYLVSTQYGSKEEIEGVYKILQDNISITYDLFPIVLGLFNKIGVHISKKNLNGIIISLCSSKLKSKISGELELKS